MILIVEDHEETRWVLLRLLQRGGYEAIGVADGAAALQFLHDHRPELIILDHMLPYVDGVGVLKEIRRDPRISLIPVLMYTAAASTTGVASKAMEAGATEVVVKGSSWGVLLSLVEKHAGPANRPPATGAAQGPKPASDANADQAGGPAPEH